MFLNVSYIIFVVWLMSTTLTIAIMGKCYLIELTLKESSMILGSYVFDQSVSLNEVLERLRSSYDSYDYLVLLSETTVFDSIEDFTEQNYL